MNGIDLNRGVMMKKAFGSGTNVYMYADQPGVFLDERGQPVDDAVARQAGFDVEALQREKLKAEREIDMRAKIAAEIEAEFAGQKTTA